MGTMRWLKYTVERIPIPRLSDIQEKEIVNKYKEYEKTSDDSLLKETDNLFYQFLGLTEAEIKVVEATVR